MIFGGGLEPEEESGAESAEPVTTVDASAPGVETTVFNQGPQILPEVIGCAVPFGSPSRQTPQTDPLEFARGCSCPSHEGASDQTSVFDRIAPRDRVASNGLRAVSSSYRHDAYGPDVRATVKSVTFPTDLLWSHHRRCAELLPPTTRSCALMNGQAEVRDVRPRRCCRSARWRASSHSA